jgi:hypothetical protein
MTTEKLVLQALVNILENVKNTNNTPVFHLVDEFMGQYEDEDGNPLWTCPAALIELVSIEWQEENNVGIQQGDLRFRVHFVDDTGFDDKKRRLSTQHNLNMAKGVKSLRLQRVWLSDLGINSDDTLLNPIMRKRTDFVIRLAETVVTIVEFEAVVTDYSLMPVWTEVIVPMLANFYMVDNELEFKQQINGT